MITTALYTCILVRTVMPSSPDTRVHRLPKETLAFSSLLDTSLSMRQVEVTVLPTLLSFCAIDLDVWLWWSQKALAAIDMQLASSWKSLSFRAARTQSSAKRKSRIRASRTLVLAFKRLRSKYPPSYLQRTVMSEGEESAENSIVASFDAFGDWSGTNPFSTMPAIMERPGEVDKPRWTANVGEYGPQALATDWGPPLTYMYISEVQNVESVGAKV